MVVPFPDDLFVTGDLEGLLAAEARAKEAAGTVSVWQALRLRNVWLLALGIFAANTGGYALAFWRRRR